MKALIAMSGGVDSSVAASLTQAQGYECIGCNMRLYSNEDAGISQSEKSCCSLDDVEDARSVAFRLGMPFYVFNMQEEFHERVIKHFVSCYLNGETPNPCIDCNRCMKFDSLMKKAEMLGCDKLVTGHYARIEQDENGKYLLKRALDPTKDQSYVLYQVTQEQLSHILFPLGNMTKVEARAYAEEHGFINAKKHDSQDICFVPDGDYVGAIKRFGGSCKPGNFLSLDGKVLGQHKGIFHYTIGQHKGLGLSFKEKNFVVEINPQNNSVTLAPSEFLFKKSLIMPNIHFISGEKPTKPFQAQVMLRYRQVPANVLVTPLEDGSYKLDFETPQRAITPGQSCVLYHGDIVLGGGIIPLQI